MDEPYIRIKSFSGLVAGSTVTIEWEFCNVPSGSSMRTSEVSYFSAARSAEPLFSEHQAISGGSDATSYSHTPPLSVGNVIYYVIKAAVYDNPACEGEAVRTVTCRSPEYTCSGDGTKPLCPICFEYRYPVIGRPFLLTWVKQEGDVPLTSMILERSLDGGRYETVYRGMAEAYRDTIPRGTVDYRTVRYRLTAVGQGYQKYSAFVYGRTADIIKSSVYVGRNGVPAHGGLLYVGVGGKPCAAYGMPVIGGK